MLQDSNFKNNCLFINITLFVYVNIYDEIQSVKHDPTDLMTFDCCKGWNCLVSQAFLRPMPKLHWIYDVKIWIYDANDVK